MGISQYDPTAKGRPAWNAGKQVGAKRALKVTAEREEESLDCTAVSIVNWMSFSDEVSLEAARHVTRRLG
jgi:hypothetical protein